jgi:hypothetical protein
MRWVLVPLPFRSSAFCGPIFPDPAPKFPVLVALRRRPMFAEGSSVSSRCGDHREHLMPRIVRNSLYFSLLPGNSHPRFQIEFRHRPPQAGSQSSRFRPPLFKLRKPPACKTCCGGDGFSKEPRIVYADGREAFCIIHRSNPLPVRCNLLSSLAASLAVSLSV